MRRWNRRLVAGACMAVWMSTGVLAQKTLTWDQAKRELEASNPRLRAARIGIQESHADEITAFLRPNPDLTVSVEQFNPLPSNAYPYRPLAETEPFLSGSYLIERRHKRDLRRASAQQGTAIAVQRPSHVIEFGRPRGGQRETAHPALERLLQLVVGNVRCRQVLQPR